LANHGLPRRTDPFVVDLNHGLAAHRNFNPLGPGQTRPGNNLQQVEGFFRRSWHGTGFGVGMDQHHQTSVQRDQQLLDDLVQPCPEIDAAQPDAGSGAGTAIDRLGQWCACCATLPTALVALGHRLHSVRDGFMPSFANPSCLKSESFSVSERWPGARARRLRT